MFGIYWITVDYLLIFFQIFGLSGLNELKKEKITKIPPKFKLFQNKIQTNSISNYYIYISDFFN